MNINISLDITMLNENTQQQKSKLNQLFIELKDNQQMFSQVSYKNNQAQKQNLIVQQKKTWNLFSKFRTEIIILFTMFLNVKQILQLRKVNTLFNQIICQTLPARIIQYQNILENIQYNLHQIPQITTMIPEYPHLIEDNIFIDWENVWNTREMMQIYGSKELEPDIYQVFKFMYISIFPDFPTVITLEQIKKMLSRPYLQYDVVQGNQILTEKQMNALQEVMLLDAQKIKVQSKFSAHICQLLQKYVEITQTKPFKLHVQRNQLEQREHQIADRLKILIKLKQKIIT